MSLPEDERRDAEKTGELVSKKLLEIMDLQAAWGFEPRGTEGTELEGRERVFGPPPLPA